MYNDSKQHCLFMLRLCLVSEYHIQMYKRRPAGCEQGGQSNAFLDAVGSTMVIVMVAIVNWTCCVYRYESWTLCIWRSGPAVISILTNTSWSALCTSMTVSMFKFAAMCYSASAIITIIITTIASMSICTFIFCGGFLHKFCNEFF